MWKRLSEWRCVHRSQHLLMSKRLDRVNLRSASVHHFVCSRSLHHFTNRVHVWCWMGRPQLQPRYYTLSTLRLTVFRYIIIIIVTETTIISCSCLQSTLPEWWYLYSVWLLCVPHWVVRTIVSTFQVFFCITLFLDLCRIHHNYYGDCLKTLCRIIWNNTGLKCYSSQNTVGCPIIMTLY